MPNRGRGVLRGLQPDNYIQNLRLWQVQKRVRHKIYVRCAMRYRLGCPATGVYENGVFREINRNHVDLEKPNLQIVEQFYDVLHDECMHSDATIRFIYQTSLERFRRRYPQFNNFPPFANVEARMRGWKNSIRMPAPETFLAFQELTETEEWERIRIYDEGRISVRCVTAANDQSALVIGDTALPQSIPNFTSLHVISTSAIQPTIEGTRNVVAFVAEWRNHACLFAVGLVNDVSEQLINQILTHVKEQFLPNHQLTSITTPFDWKWRDGARHVFEGMTLKLTFEQYCLTVLHHARHIVDLDNPLHEQVLYKLICVALEFPASMIECFNALWESLSHELIAAFLPLLSWYLSVLLIGIGPEQLSFANNFMAFHVLETKIRVTLTHRLPEHPSPWELYEKCLKTLRATWADLRTMQHGTPQQVSNIRRTPKLTTILVMGHLKRVWRLREQQTIDSTRFLCLMSQTVREHVSTCVFGMQFLQADLNPVAPDQVILDEGYFQRANVQRNPAELLQIVDLNVFFPPARPRPALRELPAALENEENDAMEVSEDEDEEEEIMNPPYNFKCINCEERPVEVICKPCRCIVLCRVCEQAMRLRPVIECPRCQRRGINLERVFISIRENVPEGEDPYDWQCHICESGAFVSVMGRACNQVVCCIECARRIRLARGPRRMHCPNCNIPTQLDSVNIRPRR